MEENRVTHRLESPEENLTLNLQANPDNQADTRASTRLDAYVQSVIPPLSDSIDAYRRLEMEDETRTHLESLVSAHMELGATYEEAVLVAIQQFGNPQQIKKSWQTQLRRKPGLLSARTAFPCAGAALAITLFLSEDKINYSDWGSLRFLTFMGLPFCAGLIAGVSDDRPIKNSAVAVWRLVPWLYLTFALWSAANHFTYPVSAATLFGTVHLVMWFVSGLTGAAVGSIFQRITQWARNYQPSGS